MTEQPTTPDPNLTPVGPFGATVKGVTDLAPHARLATAPLAPGQYGVTRETVVRWLEELSGNLAIRLDGWRRLADTLAPEDVDVDPPLLTDRQQFARYARDLVQNAAASYLEDARHPERAEPNGTQYGAVLWARYTTGLDELEAWLIRRLNDPTADDANRPRVLANFPPPLFGDGLRF